MSSASRKIGLLFVVSLLLVTILPACSAQPQSSNAHLSMTSMEKMPATVQSASVTVQEACSFL